MALVRACGAAGEGGAWVRWGFLVDEKRGESGGGECEGAGRTGVGGAQEGLRRGAKQK